MVDAKFREVIQVDEFLCIPLIARDEVFGEIILDNAFTRVPISRSRQERWTSSW